MLFRSLGETARVSAGTPTITANKGVSVTYTGTLPAGTVAVNVYFQDSASNWFKATTVNPTAISGLTFAAATAAPTVDASWANDGSGNALGYDGYINTIINNGGYVKAINGALASSEPGADFQDALISLFNNVMADPEAIVTTAAIRRSLAKSLQSQSTTTSYRLNYELGQDGIAVGSMVSAVQNEATGRMVDLVTHRFIDRKSTRLNSSHIPLSRMPSSA